MTDLTFAQRAFSFAVMGEQIAAALRDARRRHDDLSHELKRS
ncbi:hypothetical protein [Hyphococcus luteus]|nr:hypothetical protein [Marinicaulis flavus]